MKVARLLTALEPAFEAERHSAPGRAPTSGAAPSSDAAPSERRGGAASAAERRGPRTVVVDADGAVGERLAADLAALGYAVVEPPRAAGGRDADHPDRPDFDDRPARPTPPIVSSSRSSPRRGRLPPPGTCRGSVATCRTSPSCSTTRARRVGPLVEPGRGPCLRCLDLARRDADAAWPVIAAQLAGRPAASRTARASMDAAALAVAIVDDRLAHGSVALSDASFTLSRERPAGLPRRRRHAAHPECGCRALGGTETAPVRLGGRRRPAASSATAGAVPA